MARNRMKLAAFLALAQHEVQQVIEYLGDARVRQVSPTSPSEVLATVGSVKMTVPVEFAIAHSPARSGGAPTPGSDPAEILVPGRPWPPGSRARFQLEVATVASGRHAHDQRTTGTLQIEFMTVLKQ